MNYPYPNNPANFSLPAKKQSSIFGFIKPEKNTVADGVVLIAFVFGFLISPFIFSLIYTFYYSHEIQTYRLFFMLILPLIAFTIIFLLDNLTSKKLVKSGGFTFFLFFFMFNALFPYIIFPLVDLISLPNSSLNVIVTYLQIFFEIAITFFAFFFAKNMRRRCYRTYKFKPHQLFFVATPVLFFTLISIFITLFTSVHAFSRHATFNFSFLNFMASDNQNSLNSLFKTPAGTVAVLLLTLIVAPFTEELSTRQGIFQIIKNPIWAGLSSVLFFAGVHVTTDITQITSYLIPAFIFVIIYMVTYNNVTYTITAHSLYNSIITIAVLYSIGISTTLLIVYIVVMIITWAIVLIAFPSLLRHHKKIFRKSN